jgi:F-type H+-transporting ATPase subunit alpha
VRLDLAQYRELQAFAQFGSDLDKATKARLERGARTVEVMKQAQYKPMPVEKQVLSLWAVKEGYCDDIPVESVLKFESEWLAYIDTNYPQIPKGIVESSKISDDAIATLKEAVTKFKATFVA